MLLEQVTRSTCKILVTSSIAHVKQSESLKDVQNNKIFQELQFCIARWTLHRNITAETVPMAVCLAGLFAPEVVVITL
jgi:hypothetical protein